MRSATGTQISPHLAANGFLEIERGQGSGSLVTLRFGSRTTALVNGYRESIGKK